MRKRDRKAPVKRETEEEEERQRGAW